MCRWPSSTAARGVPPAARAYGKLATLGEALYLATVADLLIRDTDRRLAAVLLRVSGAEPPPPTAPANGRTSRRERGGPIPGASR